MTSKERSPFTISERDGLWVARFRAMASPCELLIRCQSETEAALLASVVVQETSRIEQKFSRYLPGNLIHRINNARGKRVVIDDETSSLLSLASLCHELSGGLFDITSGILRRAWKFDGSSQSPNHSDISGLLRKVGWEKVTLEKHAIRMLPDMEIDLGGLGKEYAVDRVAGLLLQHGAPDFMVNFGGDIRAVTSSHTSEPWRIGIEVTSSAGSRHLLHVANGGVATSGNAYRFCVVEGERLGHILNPRTGWPVEKQPASVTVEAATCLDAGILSTIAILHGAQAEAFLTAQQVRYECARHDSSELFGSTRTHRAILEVSGEPGVVDC